MLLPPLPLPPQKKNSITMNVDQGAAHKKSYLMVNYASRLFFQNSNNSIKQCIISFSI